MGAEGTGGDGPALTGLIAAFLALVVALVLIVSAVRSFATKPGAVDGKEAAKPSAGKASKKSQQGKSADSRPAAQPPAAQPPVDVLEKADAAAATKAKKRKKKTRQKEEEEEEEPEEAEQPAAAPKAEEPKPAGQKQAEQPAVAAPKAEEPKPVVQKPAERQPLERPRAEEPAIPEKTPAAAEVGSGWTEVHKRKGAVAAAAESDEQAQRRSERMLGLRRRKATISARLRRLEQGIGTVGAGSSRRDDEERKTLDRRAELLEELGHVNLALQRLLEEGGAGEAEAEEEEEEAAAEEEVKEDAEGGWQGDYEQGAAEWAEWAAWPAARGDHGKGGEWWVWSSGPRAGKGASWKGKASWEETAEWEGSERPGAWWAAGAWPERGAWPGRGRGAGFQEGPRQRRRYGVNAGDAWQWEGEGGGATSSWRGGIRSGSAAHDGAGWSPSWEEVAGSGEGVDTPAEPSSGHWEPRRKGGKAWKGGKGGKGGRWGGPESQNCCPRWDWAPAERAEWAPAEHADGAPAEHAEAGAAEEAAGTGGGSAWEAEGQEAQASWWGKRGKGKGGKSREGKGRGKWRVCGSSAHADGTDGGADGPATEAEAAAGDDGDEGLLAEDVRARGRKAAELLGARPGERTNWGDAESSDEGEAAPSARAAAAARMGIPAAAATPAAGAEAAQDTATGAMRAAGQAARAAARAAGTGGASAASSSGWDEDVLAFVGEDAVKDEATFEERLRGVPQWVAEKALHNRERLRRWG